jgi:DNA-binding IscR family transcriptional regulator
MKRILDEAAGAFFKVLDHYTLADLVRRPGPMRAALGLENT